MLCWICIQRLNISTPGAIFVILNILYRKQWLCIPDQTRVFNVVRMGSMRWDDVTPMWLCHYRPQQSSYELFSLLINSRMSHIVRQVCVSVCMFVHGQIIAHIGSKVPILTSCECLLLSQVAGWVFRHTRASNPSLSCTRAFSVCTCMCIYWRRGPVWMSQPPSWHLEGFNGFQQL